jgi:hypothetical protein
VQLAAAYLVAVKRGYPAGKFPGWDMVLCRSSHRFRASSSS